MRLHLRLKNNLRDYRLKSGLSQIELAKIVGFSKNTISSIETYQFCPNGYLAALLCEALGCKFEQLFYLDLCKEVCPADKVTEVDISEGSDPGGV